MEKKRTALLSVFEKNGLVEFARNLTELNYRLVSTGGSARVLREAGLEVMDVSELTGFPEMMDGRVKTLHPKIHAGILARRERDDDLATLEEHGIDTVDLVCVNLYPFEKVLAAGAPEAEMIENIDIGGPTLLRAAAKNFRDVTVVCDPGDYERVVDTLRADDADQLYALRRELAGKVFATTGAYDKMIGSWFLETAPASDLSTEESSFPRQLKLTLELQQPLRYGENPHQQAAFYRFSAQSDLSLASAQQLHGKELSYNNIQDTNAALELLYEFERPAVVAVKHMNPCGLAVADDIDTAWREAYEADPVSIFGGIVAANREVTVEMARAMHEIFLEIIIAPSFSAEALEILEQKKNIRLLTLPMTEQHPRFRQRFVSVYDGLLLQDLNEKKVTREDCKLMGTVDVAESDWNDLLEAFAVVKHCKSNAIVLYKDGVTVGIGVGQSNRVGACRIAIEQAGEKAKGAVLASDAFFPMPDTLELAVAAGIRAVIQPGGSLRDQDSVEVCDRAGIPMVATGFRHFKH